jgi:ubiquinone/menaquinone biosynthesis C-methylase UbiE
MPSVRSEIYDKDYFKPDLSWSRFLNARGKNWTINDSFILTLCNIRAGAKVLEIGCGRGGFIFTCARERSILAVGIDYSAEAIRIGEELVRNFIDKEFLGLLYLIRAEAIRLPLRSNLFDIIYCCFLVEHLYPEELYMMLCECWRLLKNGGRLIIETTPNLWRLKYGFSLTRFFYRIPIIANLYKKLMDVSEISKQAKTDQDACCHVNEQSILSLKKALRRTGFKAYTWVGPERDKRFSFSSFQRHWGSMAWLIWLIYSLFYRTYPFKLIFGDTIFGIGKKII